MHSGTYGVKLQRKYKKVELPSGIKYLIENDKNKEINRYKNIELSPIDECALKNNCGLCQFERECARLWDILIHEVSSDADLTTA